MPSARRFLVTFALALAAAWLVSGVVRGGGDEPTAAPPTGLRVKVERAGQPPVEAVAKFATAKLQTDYGITELDLTKVQMLAVDRVDAAGDVQTIHATAEMVDHSRLSGGLLTAEFPVSVNDRPETIRAADGMAIHFEHPKNTGLLAIVLGLLTLSLMEVVLGIDNIIFLTIEANKLPPAKQPLARNVGLAAALGTRLLLLCTLSFLMSLNRPLFTLPDFGFLHGPDARGVSARDLILLAGGVFLIGKSVKEIHEKLTSGDDAAAGKVRKAATFAQVIVQIALMDIIFSLDSVITAVGMVEDLWVMITAMVFAVCVMLVFAGPIGRFVEKNPTIKILALSFLILIGVLLVAEGAGQHIDKGYIYFAMAFAVIVELVNMRLRKTPTPAEPVTAVS